MTLTLLFVTFLASPEPVEFTCLAEAYPDAGLTLEGGHVSIRGGERFVWDDGQAKSADERLERPDLQDTMAVRYPTAVFAVPTEDPGRVRVDGFLKALYGATPEAVRKNLVPVRWMPRHGKGKTLWFNGRHGAAAALARVSADLDRMPKRFHKYVAVTAGTFNWRRISGTDRLSAHAYGIAIDVNVRFTDYWRWNLKRDPALTYKNRVPLEIAEVFERHGFVWGGRWRHFDTMHFEYRPELLHPHCVLHVTEEK